MRAGPLILRISRQDPTEMHRRICIQDLPASQLAVSSYPHLPFAHWIFLTLPYIYIYDVALYLLSPHSLRSSFFVLYVRHRRERSEFFAKNDALLSSHVPCPFFVNCPVRKERQEGWRISGDCELTLNSLAASARKKWIAPREQWREGEEGMNWD